MARTRSPEDVRALVGSYIRRECCPEISRAFRGKAAEHEGIAGTPTFEDLMSHPGMRSAVASGEGLELVRSLGALKGVTVSLSVTLFDSGKNMVAECSWHAGRGVSFRAGRAGS